MVALLGFSALALCPALGQAQKSAAPSVKTQPKETKDQLFEKKKQVIGVLEKQESDWNQGNLDGFLSAYWNSDTLVTVNVRGLSYGKEVLDRTIRKSFPDSASMGKLEYDVIHVRFIGESDALLTGKWLRKNQKKFRGGYFSILLQRINGRWMIVSEHLG